MSKINLPGGVRPLFRLFIIVRTIWGLFPFINILEKNASDYTVWVFLISITESLLTIGYLSSPRLEKRLGRVYLPAALVFATLAPWAESYAFFSIFQTGIQEGNFDLGVTFTVKNLERIIFMAMQVQLVFALFIPLILISWRYAMRWMVVFTLGLCLLDAVAIGLLTHFANESIVTGFGVVLLRTLMFLAVGFMINRLAADQREQNRQLRHYAATLEQLATSRERNRLAREIHDTLAHTLSGLAVNLEAVSALWDQHPEHAKEILNQSLGVTRSGLVETRRSIQALRAGPLEDLGLVLALKQLAASAAERYTLTMELNLPSKLAEMDALVEQCIYRVAEEGLRNIGQHAQAGKFSLGLQKNGRQIEFTLSDDGRGFSESPSPDDDHFGLQGMRERTQAIGGRLEVFAQPGQGTTLKLYLESES